MRKVGFLVTSNNRFNADKAPGEVGSDRRRGRGALRVKRIKLVRIGGIVGETKAGDKRSPLKQGPLRLPGESLSQERDRILNEDVLPVVVTVAFAIVYAALEWWRWLTKSPPQPGLVTLVALGAVAYFAYRVTKIRVQLRSLKLGLEGEKVVGQYLEAHRGVGWHVFHDVCGPGFNVDHVVVSPRGVFVVETKTFSKPAKGEAVVRYDGTKVVVNGHEPDRNPITQVRAGRDWIRDLLMDTTTIRYPVRGAVVFPGWWVESPKSGPRPDVWVLNEKAFVKWAENEPVVVRDEDVALAANRLKNYVIQQQRSD